MKIKTNLLQIILAAGNELQTGVDKMIKECRMQGADHDALHLWLEPLMKNVAALKKAASEQEASQALAGITERLDMYTQYFE